MQFRTNRIVVIQKYNFYGLQMSSDRLSSMFMFYVQKVASYDKPKAVFVKLSDILTEEGDRPARIRQYFVLFQS